jgi:predicted RNA binding protein YcfA (HicA-like mRNA interferase family)
VSTGTIKLSSLVKFIEANNFYKCRQKGSHATYKNDALKLIIVIPVNRKDALEYLVADVRKLLKLSKNEFEVAIKKF